MSDKPPLTSRADSVIPECGDSLTLELLAALKELVQAGEHEGPCDNRDEDGLPFMDSGPCSLHLAASERRRNLALDVIARAEGTADERTSHPKGSDSPDSTTKG